MDRTVYVCDISGLPKSILHAGPAAFETFDNISTIKYILEGHDYGVNFAMFHPTLPLIISAVDQDPEDSAWQVDSCWGRFNNVFSVVFHPKHKLIVFYCEDKTVYESLRSIHMHIHNCPQQISLALHIRESWDSELVLGRPITAVSSYCRFLLLLFHGNSE